jgi:hypothetical protein
MGGTIKAVEEGYFQHEIADSAYDTARRRASGDQPLIGVNRFVEPAAPVPVPIHKVDAAVEARQVARLRETRARRDGARVKTLLGRLEAEARSRGQPDAPDDRAGHGARDPRRDRRAPENSLWRVRREARLLMPPRPFRIDVPQAVLDDLRERLARTRWPDQAPGAAWAYGADVEYMKELCAYWRDHYDWRTHEATLNGFRQFTAPVAGIDLHFIHEEGRGPKPLPLLLSHGWPGSIYEFHKIIPMLTDPARFGGDPGDAFTVVAPSLPGYGFSFAIAGSPPRAAIGAASSPPGSASHTPSALPAYTSISSRCAATCRGRKSPRPKSAPISKTSARGSAPRRAISGSRVPSPRHSPTG